MSEEAGLAMVGLGIGGGLFGGERTGHVACEGRHPGFTLPPVRERERKRERDTSAWK